MIRFDLVTLSGTKVSDSVFEVILPTPDGSIAVFLNHMPLISLASPGVISVRRKAGDPDTRMEHYATNGGVIEISHNIVRVLVDEADSESEINEQEAKKAHDAAKHLRSQAKDDVSLEHAQSLVDRQATRLRVAELRRRRRA
jgi:F-type H+-transporting ATPase subunit epsilon